jgi:hypothetical protein
MANPAPDISRLFAGPFPALEDRLLSGLAAGAGRSPGRERVVLVPSNDLREHLLKRLAARADAAAAGLSFLTLYDFALRLLKHQGAFPRPLPAARMTAVLSAAVNEVYAGGDGRFSAISARPGFLPSLERTLADLEEGWLDAGTFREAERTARGRGDAAGALRWAEWRRVLAAVERKIRAVGGMSRRKIFQRAVAGFEKPGYPFRTVLYGFYDFTRLQWTLVDALLSSGLLDEVYFPGLFDGEGRLSPAFAYARPAWDRLLRAFEGNVEHLEDDGSEGVAAVRRRLFSGVPPDGPSPVPFTVLSAPHEGGEMRLAARLVRRWLDADPGCEVLLLSRKFEEEAVFFWERCAQEYGIRTVERMHAPLASVPPVRVLVQIIEAALEGYPRRKVLDILSSPYRRLACDGAAAPRPDLWDVMSRELLVVSGADWETRLDRPRPREADDGEKDRSEREAQLALLKEEVRALRKTIEPVLAATGHAALAKSLRFLAVRDFRIVDDGSPEGERDRRALAMLLSLLDDVERIPEREVPWSGPAAALAAFRTLLSEQSLFLGEKGGMRVPGAVVVGDLFAMRGVTADRVLFLSCNEDLVPAQISEDPLLPDEDREEINRLTRRPGWPDALALKRRNAAEEKLLFSLPSASARRELAYSVLRADAEGTQKRPSRYLLHLLAQFSGIGVYAQEWLPASAAPTLRLFRAPFASLESPGPVSPREEALFRWRRGETPRNVAGRVPWERIIGTLRSRRDREAGRSLFPWGPSGRRASPASSATELDELAKCPYRYFLRFVLRLSPADEPEEGLFLSPAETGIIVHDILRILGRRAADKGEWGDAEQAARQAAARFARKNPTGLPGLFRLQVRSVERDAAAFVAWENERSASPGSFRLAAVEQPFTVAGDRGLPAFRGRVDRIDRGPDGEAEIIDYKYKEGKREKAPLDWMAGGLSNQIPVYLAYARTLSPPPPALRATLLFLRNGIVALTVTGEQWKAVREDWSASARAWLSLASEGIFPPLPHNRFRYAEDAPPRYCDGCPFRDHCRVSPAFEGTEREVEALCSRVATEAALRPVAQRRTLFPPR